MGKHKNGDKTVHFFSKSPCQGISSYLIFENAYTKGKWAPSLKCFRDECLETLRTGEKYYISTIKKI